MSNPNPQNKFQKGNKQASKKLVQPNLMTREQHQVGVELRVAHVTVAGGSDPRRGFTAGP